MPNMFDIESSYPGKIIAGVDEAGRGALAGPVVAASVIFNPNSIVIGVKDSKKLSINQRNKLFAEITSKHEYSVGIVWQDDIDKINILNATIKACILGVSNLKTLPEIVIIDGNMKFEQENFISYIGGDNLSYTIAAASIVAKVTRDTIMHKLAAEYPKYLWQRNVGYGTKHHIDAIREFGQCEYHRKSFKII